jgi:trehalose utilization protein
MKDIKLTIWNEYRHEKLEEKIKKVYPKGIHEALAKFFRKRPGIAVQTATLDEPEHGLTEKMLKNTDVLIWWGHMAHGEVRDEIVDRVQKRVLEGMGLIVLHSGHHSKIFRRLMGTSCNLKWRESDDKEILWVTNPNHPITQGIGSHIILEAEEMYGEFFDIPEPTELLFTSWFAGGEVFRSGATWARGKGKIFYFQPGHESYPTFYNPNILKVIENAVRWAKFSGNDQIEEGCPCFKPLITNGKKK